VEPQTAFVGADLGVELDPETPVHVLLTLVVQPGDTEADHPFGLREPLHDVQVVGLVVENGLQGGDDLGDLLEELLLMTVHPLDLLDQLGLGADAPPGLHVQLGLGLVPLLAHLGLPDGNGSQPVQHIRGFLYLLTSCEHALCKG